MTEGTSQGLFIVVAIVIFGIFVGMSYLVFGKVLEPKMVEMFETATNIDFKGGSEGAPDIPVDPEKEDEYVVFEDESLENQIKRMLKIYGSDAKIPISRMKEVTTLNYFSVSSLKGMEHATNLETLKLSSGSALLDLSHISNLTNLKELTFSYVNIQDITKIKNLTNLENLEIEGLYKSLDYTVLSNLTNLKKLTLKQTNLTSIDMIKNLTKLEKLTLSYTQITDITLLKSLTNLKYLDLSNQWNGLAYNAITDIKPLYNLSNLEYLNLESSIIPDAQIEYMQENSTKLTTFIYK